MSLWEIEQEYAQKGCKRICGADEAGAGPLAGPVYAGAVILPPGLELPWLNDSKQVTERRRDILFEQIKELLAEQLDLDESKITMDSDIVEDLEADSLDVVDLVMSMEDEFGVEVPDEVIENFKTVGDVVRYIEENT